MAEKSASNASPDRDRSASSSPAAARAGPITNRRSSPRTRGPKRSRNLPPPLEIAPPDPSPSSPLPDAITDQFSLQIEPEPHRTVLVHGRTLAAGKIREIGRGRYGTVDLMREQNTGLEMAVKVGPGLEVTVLTTVSGQPAM